jgi:hypothetical protein
MVDDDKTTRDASAADAAECARIGQLWDEGLASGRAEPDESIAEIKVEARCRRSPGQARR